MRPITYHVFSFLLLLSFNPEVTSQQNCRGFGTVSTNGCSIPGGLPFFYKRLFTPACNKHDVCYACGQFYGWSRGQCDGAFFRDMLKLCLFKALFKKTCTDFSLVYYTAVVVGGRKHFKNISPTACLCAKSRGDPTTTLSGY